MIERAYIHIAGPEGSGKTTLVEAVLGVFDGLAITARCRRNDDLAESVETIAGASGAARFEFPADEEDGDGFFSSNVMTDYSKAVLIEGDCPIAYVDLEVFVAPPLPARSLLRRTKVRTPAVSASALEKLLLGAGHRLKRPARTSWELASTHRGLERAGLVVVNVRAGDDRTAAERLLGAIAQIRSDDDVRAAVLGRFAHRTKVTAVVADLCDRKDAGTKKALTRIKRALVQRDRS